MKKNLTAILLVMLIFNIRIWASDTNQVNPLAKFTFQQDYPGALYATWIAIKNEDIYAVRFVHCNSAAVAYYDKEGFRIAIAKIVKISMLPAKIKFRIIGLYKEAEIKEIQQLVMYNRTCYYFKTECKGIKKVISIQSNDY